MDPYLEPHWLDVHTSLVSGARDRLNQVLPEDLVASAEERIAVESEEDQVREFRPDVKVSGPRVPDADRAGVLKAPFRLTVEVEPMIERFLRVVETGSQRVIAVIEFLSPSNKTGEGLRVFRCKRAELLAAGVHFVEVDLQRTGNWRGLLRPHRCPAPAVSPYRVTLRVCDDPGATYLHPIRLQDPLPEIDIPLRKGDPQVKLPLQELLAHAYVAGRYARRLDYRAPCTPPLAEDDAQWAEELLRRAGKR